MQGHLCQHEHTTDEPKIRQSTIQPIISAAWELGTHRLFMLLPHGGTASRETSVNSQFSGPRIPATGDSPVRTTQRIRATTEVYDSVLWNRSRLLEKVPRLSARAAGSSTL